MTRRVALPEQYLAGLRVLVTSIPEGRVIAYSDAATVIGYGSGRHSAAALSAGLLEGTPWWRVIRTDGTITGDLAGTAARHWHEEGTPLKTVSKRGARGEQSGGSCVRVDMRFARWSPPDDVLRAVDAAIDDAAPLECPPLMVN
jgi:alkylated DNA nucleotide flippase Atl1